MVFALLWGMKWIIFIALLLPQNSYGLEPDKQKHINYSAVIGLVTYGALRAAGQDETEAAYGALIYSIGLGVLKELTDQRFDGEDLVADVAGASFGVAIPLFVESF